MKKSIIILTITFISLWGCSTSSDQADKAQASIDTVLYDNRLPEQPTKTVINFLTWYKDNYESISSIQLIIWGNDDTTIPYSVDTIGTKEYLDYFNKSGFVSDKYIRDWTDYFSERQQYFEENLEYDGPPSGFEFDFVLLTQEYDKTLAAIDNPKLINIEIKESRAIVKIDIMKRLSFTLTKSTDRWLIDHIDNLGLE
ncbi:MAG: hypothetical protein JKX74_01310 [Flavobacteriales bacterium]|nr:hypothetical protein [Flavobacteriales bacterium]